MENKEKLRIFVITQNEPFYIPKMIRLLLESQTDNYKIVGYTVLSPSRKNKSIYSWFKERSTIYSYYELFIVGFAFIYTKFLAVFNLSNAYNNKKLFRKHNIEELITNDINSDTYIEELKKLNADIILSISCPQLFGEKLLETPSKFCLNAHGTLLPRHRGVFGSFWTLYDKDKVAGGTLHTMELKLDAGDILWQKEFPVNNKDTQFSIAYKTKKTMAYGLVELFKQSSKGEYNIIEPQYSSSYHRAPSREQGKEFRKNGKHIVTFKDLFLMLSKSY